MSCVILLLGLVAFTPYTLQAQEETKSGNKTLTKLAVIPFQAVIMENGSSTVQCPVCGSVNSSGTIVKGAEKIVEEIFTDKLKNIKNVELISPERAAGVYQLISADSLKQPLSRIIQKVGNELHADVLAIGFVYRYRERVGYDYSAERPASIAFEIHMISVKDGSTLWRGIYDKTQKSLMEDVLQAPSFFKDGAKWVTARELTRIGINDVFKTFSGFEH